MKWNKLFEFLYDNGFRYVARCYDDTLSALAFVNEPEYDGQQFGGVYYDPKQGDIFMIDLDLRGNDTFPVELGHYMEISDLLKREK